MADNHSKNIYKEIIKAFFLSFKRLSLYAATHPLSKEILGNLFKIFDTFLKDNPELLIVIGLDEGEMLVNQDPLSKDVMGVAEVYEKFKAFKLDGMSFIQGLTYDELVDFVKALATASVIDGGRQASVPELLRSGSAHIKIKKIRYEKVDEDQKVVEKGAAEGGGPGSGSGDGLGLGLGTGIDTLGDIRNFLTGKNSDIGAGAEKVFESLDQDVAQVADAIIQSAKESGDFEGVIKKFVSWLSKNVTPILVEKKRDPSKFIEKLFDSFKKDERAKQYPSSAAVIEECADEIKLAMVEEAFFLNQESPKKAVHAAARILSDEEDQKKLFPKIAGRLAGRGVPEDQAREFAQKTEAELAKDEDVPISKKKLARLLRLSEKFDEEVERRVRNATEALTRQNRRLCDEKERSEGIMRHLADGLVVVDKSGKVVMMNPAAEKLLNTEMKESLGKSLVEGLKEEHVLAVAKGPLDDKDGGPITKEIELAGKDEATKRVLRASSAVVENEDGKTVGMVSVLSDITHQKEVEEMKSNFVSLVTHELRTPVVAIQKSLELILSKATGEITEDQERFLSISKFNLERLNRLINDLLDISKLEVGKLVLKPSSFDFRDILVEVKASLNSWAKDKEIAILLDTKDEPLPVTADRDRMIQVLVNLVGNALKFTPAKGEVHVTLNPLGRKDGVCEEPCLEVSVVDNGIGIDPKDFKRIFNKFEQVSLVSPSGTGGSGLGLPIAKEIVSLHGGTIWVESQLGQGSRFFFVIPRTRPLKTK